MDLAPVVAAIVGILGFLQWRRSHKREEGHLQVSARFKSRTEEGIAFLVELRNKGRYPVYVESIELVLKSDEKLPYRNIRGLHLEKPIEVTDGRPRELLFPIYSYMNEIKEPSQIKRIEVTDTKGTLYRYPGRIRSRKSFQRQIESEWTEERQEYWSQQLQNEDENRS